MKRRVLSIASTVLFAAFFTACKSSPEPTQTPTEPMEETSQIPQEPMEQPQQPQAETPAPSADQLHDQVASAFQQEEGLDASRIRIVVDDNGVVILSGTVASEEEKRRAHEIAHGVAGVSNVYIGELQVDTSQATR